MKINQNNEISIYRGETGAIDFKISQRSDYYVPFLISSLRVNPMVCITIGSTHRESKNITSKQLWLELDNVPKFEQTVVEDLGEIDDSTLTTTELLKAHLVDIIEPGTLYQFTLKSEVEASNSQLHFAYSVMVDLTEVVHIDDYDFTVTMSLDETITLDMTNGDYMYQIELLDTVPMLTHLQSIFTAYPELINKLPDAFENTELGITEYMKECIDLVNKTWPKHWGYRINDPYTSPVASVSASQMLQPPRKFTVLSVVK